MGRPACEPACLLGVGAGCGAGAAHGEALDLVDEHADERVVVLEDLLPGGRYREIEDLLPGAGRGVCQAQGGVCARRSARSKRRAAASVAREAQLGEACDTTLVRSLILANMPSTILPLSENLRRGAWREG